MCPLTNCADDHNYDADDADDDEINYNNKSIDDNENQCDDEDDNETTRLIDDGRVSRQGLRGFSSF